MKAFPLPIIVLKFEGPAFILLIAYAQVCEVVEATDCEAPVSAKSRLACCLESLVCDTLAPW